MSAPTVHVVGRLTSDPELRWTPAGHAVATFTVAGNDRRKNASGEWEDGEACFLRCTVWRETAENAAESLTRGTEVILVGKLRTRTWETKDGEKRSVIECEVDAIGPSLRWGVARLVKAERASKPSPVDDPWATGPSRPATSWPTDGPPF